MTWLTREREPGVVDVVPLDDLIVHEFCDDCPCGPRVEIITGDHPDGQLCSHPSLDGRERFE